jgi:hypothetical protein
MRIKATNKQLKIDDGRSFNEPVKLRLVRVGVTREEKVRRGEEAGGPGCLKWVVVEPHYRADPGPDRWHTAWRLGSGPGFVSQSPPDITQNKHPGPFPRYLFTAIASSFVYTLAAGHLIVPKIHRHTDSHCFPARRVSALIIVVPSASLEGLDPREIHDSTPIFSPSGFLIISIPPRLEFFFGLSLSFS